MTKCMEDVSAMIAADVLGCPEDKKDHAGGDAYVLHFDTRAPRLCNEPGITEILMQRLAVRA